MKVKVLLCIYISKTNKHGNNRHMKIYSGYPVTDYVSFFSVKFISPKLLNVGTKLQGFMIFTFSLFQVRCQLTNYYL